MRDPTSRFNGHYALFEQPLAATRTNERFLLRISHVRVGLDLRFESMLPRVEIIPERLNAISFRV